jgi:hypothetical protein
MATFFEIHMKYINILCKQNADSFKFKGGGMYNNNCTPKGLAFSIYERNFLYWAFPYVCEIARKEKPNIKNCVESSFSYW